MRNAFNFMNHDPSLLLVDDEPELLAVIEQRFRWRCFNVTACPDAPTAEMVAGNQSFQVALLDRTLGAHDGLALASRLKQIQPQLRIIMLSGHGDAQSRAEAEELGIFDYLTKPCGLAELENSVRNACQSVAEL
jgi:DNA-binding response OmpR family regulator